MPVTGFGPSFVSRSPNAGLATRGLCFWVPLASFPKLEAGEVLD